MLDNPEKFRHKPSKPEKQTIFTCGDMESDLFRSFYFAFTGAKGGQKLD